MLTYSTGPPGSVIVCDDSPRVIECDRCGQSLDSFVNSLYGFQQKTAGAIMAEFPNTTTAMRKHEATCPKVHPK